MSLPNKSASGGTGRPVQAWIDRQRDAPVMTLWPVPDATTPYEFHYYRVRRYRDVPALASGVDLPARFLPAMVSGLAYYLARMLPQVPPELRQELKADYMQDLAEAEQADQDRGGFRVEADLSSYWRGT